MKMGHARQQGGGTSTLPVAPPVPQHDFGKELVISESIIARPEGALLGQRWPMLRRTGISYGPETQAEGQARFG